ncbi:MAG: hypothetical protein PUC53_02735 [Bacteroidales bacterium]|nr:hypothetical protein [Bacteroidales bacterium]
MAKKVDQFEKFRAATLGRPSELSSVIQSSQTDARNTEVENVTPSDNLVEAIRPQESLQITNTTVEISSGKVSKNADRELVSFHIAKDRKKKLGLLKYQQERSFGELYSEAIDDLLKKYGVLDN